MFMRRSLQFRVLRGKGTEAPGTGKYDKWSKEGVYSCAGCGTPLYKSTTKFDSGCGWPAFFDGTLPRRHHRGAFSHAQQASSYDCDQPFPALSVAKSTAAASCPRQRSFATLVEGTWATFSKEKVSLRPVSATNNLTSPTRNRIHTDYRPAMQPTNGTASTLSPSTFMTTRLQSEIGEGWFNLRLGVASLFIVVFCVFWMWARSPDV